MPGSGVCIFCGTEGTMTGEDVLGQWLQRIDLDQSPVQHGTGWLNRIGRDIGTRPPYRQRIRDVCQGCNSGWMSGLENMASHVLTPFILGTAGAITGHDLGAIAAWAQKTCLTAMYVSTAEDRAAGYGLPAAEYHELHQIRDAQEPLPHSQFWMGRFNGEMTWSVRVTPLVVAIAGLREPEFPHGYLMTVVLGQLLLQGVRMTAPAPEVTAGTRQGMSRIWPGISIARWPEGEPVDDSGYQAFALGRDLLIQEPEISLRPWKPAAELPATELTGDMAALSTACGKPAAPLSEHPDGRGDERPLLRVCRFLRLRHLVSDPHRARWGTLQGGR